jgi:outer membrane receptor protein involved in Fe transport
MGMKKRFLGKLFLFTLIAFTLIATLGFAQSITSGDITGVVSDPSGAVVPNATVTATNTNTGVVHHATTNGEGVYRFSFLQPGPYKLSINAQGFQPAARNVQVSVGQAANGNVALAVTAATTTIEVTTPALQVENADVSTTFSQEQIALVPNPGNDLSAIAQTSPGAVMNTQSGFGNFSSFGLPGTSNLFTIDGQNDNDPFLNLNNSGATNLLLGANDVQEATVTTNGYSSQYGQLAGAQVNYVTRSGGNNFHGNATYYWNGRVMNANNYFNNQQIQGSPSVPKPFDNTNQWAVGFGGPIIKDKTFFFFDYEGLRIVLPTTGQVRIPTPGFEAATIANLTSKGLTASIPFYQNIFALYNGTPNAANGTPGPCAATSFTPPAGFDPNNCRLTVQNTATNFTHEYQVSLKLDHKFNEKDSLFARVQNDHGLQATSTDRINPIFNTQSDQPEYQGQIGETHVFSPNVINEFKGSVLWYSAIFDNANRSATLATFPTTVQFSGGFSRIGGIDFFFPQGRNVTQGQVVDDFSITKGRHTLRMGANYRRYDVTDADFGTFTSGLAVTSVDTFFNGGTDVFQQNFPTRLTQPIALYGLGFYGQDEWRVNNKLKLTLGLRIDHNSNPVCQTNCFAELAVPFTSLDHTNSENIPYNQTIRSGLHQAYPSTDIVVWQPRLGFTFSPMSKTVLRGGIGIFGDSFPAVLVDNFASNPPILSSFFVTGNLAPQETNNVFALASGANASFTSAFANGGTMSSIAATNPFFFPPAITASDAKIRQPRYQEWNLELQQDLGWNTVLSLNYVGNHGIFEPVQNNGVNAFADSTNFPNGFAGLPAGRVVSGITVGPDARFSTVNQIQSIAVSNYNGLVTSLRHQFNRGFAFQLNYTWSHALDEVSNGGLLPFNDATDVSPLNPFNPFNIRANYGNADYDIRHYFSANYVWEDSLRHLFKWGPNAVFSGWTISGTIFSRSGLPFTVIDSGTASLLSGDNFGGTLPAQIVSPTGIPSCDKTNATPNPATGNVTPCLNGAAFASPTGLNFNQARNQFRGPNYFNTDLAVMKHTKLRENLSLGVGFQFFNLFNHPNFDLPLNDFAAFAGPGVPASPGDFGTITSTVNTPTSILGSFLGGDASPRLIQVKAELKF